MTKNQTIVPETYEAPVIEDIASISMLKGQDASGGSDTPHDDDEM